MVPDGYKPLGLQVGMWKGRWSTEGMGQTLWLLSLLESPVVREFRHEDFTWLSQVAAGLQICSQSYNPGKKVQKRTKWNLLLLSLLGSLYITLFLLLPNQTHPRFSLQIYYLFCYNYCYIKIKLCNVALMYICVFSAVSLELNHL